MKLLDIATRNSFFLFNKKLYRQREGLGMGLPHSPVFANIFLAFHEEHWLTNYPAHFKPVFYRRHVDDRFVLFSDKSHAPLFLNYLNQHHNNINLNPPSVAIWQRLQKISILIWKGIIKKISYERRAYESVDEESLS